jgi:uncharacterized membrane protein
MKTVAVLTGFFALTVLLGCQDTSKPGGPGVNKPAPDTTSTKPTTTPDRTTTADNDEPIIGQKDETFELDLPNLATDVTQGETEELTIGINRGDNFQEDVTIKFDKLPDGVTATPAAPKIMKGDDEVKVTLAAAADAAVGDFDVQVIGQPTKGPAATNMLKLKVEKP